MLSNSSQKVAMADHLYRLPESKPTGRATPVRRSVVTPKYESDLDYFHRRSLEERRLAMAASDMHARELHLELADRYTGLVAAIAEAQDKIG
jgi:hypothetical protein